MSGEMLPQPAPMAAPPVMEPKRLKVFGVIHIVLGGLGLVYLVLQVVMLLLKGAIEKMSAAGQPEEFIEFQRELNSATALGSWIGLLLSAVVAVLILLAGISLVRRKKNCLAMNNLYGWASIAAKAVGVIVFAVLVMPAINQTLDKFVESAPPDVVAMMKAVKVVASAAGVLMPLLTAIYPMLALILLNKPVVKDFLAQHGT